MRLGLAPHKVLWQKASLLINRNAIRSKSLDVRMMLIYFKKVFFFGNIAIYFRGIR